MQRHAFQNADMGSVGRGWVDVLDDGNLAVHHIARRLAFVAAPVDDGQRQHGLLIVPGMPIQHDDGHREEAVKLAGNARQPGTRPVARFEIDRQKNEAFYLPGLYTGIAEKTRLPSSQHGEFIVGELEQEGHALPVGQAGCFRIELIAAAQQGFKFSGKRLGLRGPVQGFVAGVPEDREQFEGTYAQVAGGR